MKRACFTHFILQVTDAESQKTVAEKEHQLKAAAFIEAETKVNY